MLKYAGFRDVTPRIWNQTDKQIEYKMETWRIQGVLGILTYVFLLDGLYKRVPQLDFDMMFAMF